MGGLSESKWAVVLNGGAPTADTRAAVYGTVPNIYVFFSSISAKSFIATGSYNF